MREYVIMTDSCCDLPPELAAELQLTVLPLYFYFAGQGRYNFLDNREMDPKAFYNHFGWRVGALSPALMQPSERMPVTSPDKGRVRQNWNTKNRDRRINESTERRTLF